MSYHLTKVLIYKTRLKLDTWNLILAKWKCDWLNMISTHPSQIGLSVFLSFPLQMNVSIWKWICITDWAILPFSVFYLLFALVCALVTFLGFLNKFSATLKQWAFILLALDSYVEIFIAFVQCLVLRQDKLGRHLFVLSFLYWRVYFLYWSVYTFVELGI